MLAPQLGGLGALVSVAHPPEHLPPRMKIGSLVMVNISSSKQN